MIELESSVIEIESSVMELESSAIQKDLFNSSNDKLN